MMNQKKSLIKSKLEDTIDREKIVYKSSKNTYDFRKFQTIRNFLKDIYDDEITLEEADKNQSDLINEINDFIDKTRPKKAIIKNKKKVMLLIV